MADSRNGRSASSSHDDCNKTDDHFDQQDRRDDKQPRPRFPTMPWSTRSRSPRMTPVPPPQIPGPGSLRSSSRKPENLLPRTLASPAGVPKRSGNTMGRNARKDNDRVTPEPAHSPRTSSASSLERQLLESRLGRGMSHNRVATQNYVPNQQPRHYKSNPASELENPYLSPYPRTQLHLNTPPPTQPASSVDTSGQGAVNFGVGYFTKKASLSAEEYLRVLLNRERQYSVQDLLDPKGSPTIVGVGSFYGARKIYEDGYDVFTEPAMCRVRRDCLAGQYRPTSRVACTIHQLAMSEDLYDLGIWRHKFLINEDTIFQWEYEPRPPPGTKRRHTPLYHLQENENGEKAWFQVLQEGALLAVEGNSTLPCESATVLDMMRFFNQRVELPLTVEAYGAAILGPSIDDSPDANEHNARVARQDACNRPGGGAKFHIVSSAEISKRSPSQSDARKPLDVDGYDQPAATAHANQRKTYVIPDDDYRPRTREEFAKERAERKKNTPKVADNVEATSSEGHSQEVVDMETDTADDVEAISSDENSEEAVDMEDTADDVEAISSDEHSEELTDMETGTANDVEAISSDEHSEEVVDMETDMADDVEAVSSEEHSEELVDMETGTADDVETISSDEHSKEPVDMEIDTADDVTIPPPGEDTVQSAKPVRFTDWREQRSPSPINRQPQHPYDIANRTGGRPRPGVYDMTTPNFSDLLGKPVDTTAASADATPAYQEQAPVSDDHHQSQPSPNPSPAEIGPQEADAEEVPDSINTTSPNSPSTGPAETEATPPRTDHDSIAANAPDRQDNTAPNTTVPEIPAAEEFQGSNSGVPTAPQEQTPSVATGTSVSNTTTNNGIWDIEEGFYENMFKPDAEPTQGATSSAQQPTIYSSNVLEVASAPQEPSASENSGLARIGNAVSNPVLSEGAPLNPVEDEDFRSFAGELLNMDPTMPYDAELEGMVYAELGLYPGLWGTASVPAPDANATLDNQVSDAAGMEYFDWEAFEER